MNFQTLADNAKAVKKKAEALVDTVTKEQHKRMLDNFYVSIKKLSNFLDDKENRWVLCEHDKKATEDQDKFPLDILCSDALARLSEVKHLFVCGIFDYISYEHSRKKIFIEKSGIKSDIIFRI